MTFAIIFLALLFSFNEASPFVAVMKSAQEVPKKMTILHTNGRDQDVDFNDCDSG